MGEPSDKSPIRLKFMPTPSGPMHVGHAWLLFVMDTLTCALRNLGHRADWLLVFDDMTTLANNSDARTVEKNIRQILIDCQRLEVRPAMILSNSEVFWLRQADLQRQDSIELTLWKSQFPLSPAHFVKNASLDLHLGVTHIIRGADWKPFLPMYQECYSKLGGIEPLLTCIPLVNLPGGGKISAIESYQIKTVLRHMSCEELCLLLAKQCLRDDVVSNQFVGPGSSGRLLLKEFWSSTIGSTFMKTGLSPIATCFVADPRIGTEDGKCVPAEDL